MGRKVAIAWHASFTVGAGVLYFYFVLPRWPELMGEISPGAGMTLRIVTGSLIGLAALPVIFTLLRTRKPELATPQLALTLRTWSIVAHVLAGALIIGTAISEIWFSLDTAGQWLFAIYGAAAAIGVLGFFAFYLSFVAELPPPPPKPIKPQKVRERRIRGKKRGKTVEVAAHEDDADDAAATDEAAEPEATEDAETQGESPVTEEDSSPESVEASTPTLTEEEGPAEPSGGATEEPAEARAPRPEETTESPTSPRLRNRRPTGKRSHRRRRTRGSVTVEE